MKKLFLLTAIISSIFFMALISAQPINTTNYTASSSNGMSVTMLKYTPYPANPGEYIDIWIQAQFYGTSSPLNTTFVLKPTFPFSLDPNESAVKSFGKIGTGTVVLHYKVRIDKDAIAGDNELDLGYSSGGGMDNAFLITPLNIQIQNAQTDFDLVVQDSSSSGTSIGIANIGENTANSLIAKIPEQPNFRVTGTTNGQILGNLNAGDYTLATFQVTQTNPRNNTLEIELDYTDAIGIRRTIIKDVTIGAPAGTDYTGNFTRSFQENASNFREYNGQAIINGQRVNFQRNSILNNAWFWIVIAIIILTGGFVGYSTYKRKHHIGNFKEFLGKMKESRSKKAEGKKDKKAKEKEDSKEPDWVTAERAKKGK